MRERRGLTRRALLRGSLAAGGAAAAVRLLPGRAGWQPDPTGGTGGPGVPLRPAGAATRLTPAAFPEWARHARIADATFDDDADPARDMRPVIDALKKQNVSVIEVDTILSNWLTDAEFTQHLGKIHSFAELAHTAGMRVVMYYPSLELISVGGEKGPSFYKTAEGASWVQRDLTGQPNVFYGSLVVWVDPGDESCWLSPNSPWRDYYLGRVKKIAATGVDAIWPDVPIYFDGALSWCDTSSWATAAFTGDTGLPMPAKPDFKDPVFRRYVDWRHHNLNQWQLDIAAAGRSANPDLVTFVETVTMDYDYATTIGLDGALLRTAENASHVWEVDILGNYDGMRHATADDWICLISMYKYARAASGTKPAWAFSYGWQADDASLVLAEVLAAGCNPYEVKTPFKSDSADLPTRTRVYGFAAAHRERLFDAERGAEVGLYHSSAGRDFTAPRDGSGMYVNTKPPAGVEEWWSENYAEESCLNHPWLGEFRGTVKALVRAQIPFDTVPSPGLTAAGLARYRVLLLPYLQAVSDAEAAVLRDYVTGGGTLVVTGPTPTSLTEYGTARTEYALADVLGFGAADPQPETREHAVGAGTCHYVKDLAGLRYLGKTDQATADRLLGPVRAAAPPVVGLTGDPRIHLELSRLGDETLVQLVNFTCFGDAPAAFTTRPATCTVRLTVPAGRRVTAVTVSSPDGPSPDPRPVPWQATGDAVTAEVTVAQYALLAFTTATATTAATG
ncbi:beta-galactosidase trimerization domain-containing protein [Streptomyces sp. NPDC003703]|uniref:beta-galactosidase trimerization domain-containing protein n=1 Tax=Streptomyces sp. NPDC003283 TaxID=3364681 RepID=UPI0036B9D560